jgi:uncharacterized protein YbjQ (UPF0145 family)
MILKILAHPYGETLGRKFRMKELKGGSMLMVSASGTAVAYKEE